jgi:hypothetical protein
MLACNKLRIDSGDDSPAVEYRFESDRVERRILERASDRGEPIDEPWQQLTPEQLSSHVMSDTVIAQWLRRRMGVRRLIRACNLDSPFANN